MEPTIYLRLPFGDGGFAPIADARSVIGDTENRTVVELARLYLLSTHCGHWWLVGVWRGISKGGS
jgi:hypothetical protein